MIRILDDSFRHKEFVYGVEVPVRWTDGERTISLSDLEHWIENQNFNFHKRYREFWFSTPDDRLAFVLAWV